MRITYLNLTNGIEKFDGSNNRFIRIQSTWCEQKRWEDILMDLDYDFLMQIILGNSIMIIDASPKKKVSRALYQGVEWIKYFLQRFWFDNHNYIPFVKGYNVKNYFDQCYSQLSDRVFKRYEYFKKFINDKTKIDIDYHCYSTNIDSRYDLYKEILTNKTLKSIGG